MSLVWTEFDPKWFAFFKKRTGRAFNFKNVCGQCAFVADLYRQYLGRGENQYGFYSGPVTNAYWHSAVVQRHGWIRLKKSIVDPTRWCFMEEQTPMLAQTDLDDEHYDVGMRRFKSRLFADWHQNMPDYNGKPHECDQPDLVLLFEGQISIERLFWVANQIPGSKVFVDEAERTRIFKWLQAQKGLSGLIPIDNRV